MLVNSIHYVGGVRYQSFFLLCRHWKQIYTKGKHALLLLKIVYNFKNHKKGKK